MNVSLVIGSVGVLCGEEGFVVPPTTPPSPLPSNPDVTHVYGDCPDEPIQLVRPDPLGHRKLEIVDANVKCLRQINSAVAVIAVVGKFHSGKSFLLNQLMGKQEGFGIGPSVRPQTMGIWMWGQVSRGEVKWWILTRCKTGDSCTNEHSSSV